MLSTGSLVADTLLAQAIQASQENNGMRALELLKEAITAAPTSGIPYFMLASEQASRGEMDQAEMAFANAVLLAPDFHIARYQLGLLQFSSGRAAMALVTWQPLMALPETDPMPHFIRGFMVLAQDAFAEALVHYRAGLERNTSNPPMSADIQKIIEQIRSLPNISEAASTPSMNNIEEKETASTEEHVLLSNYQKQGQFH